MCAGQHGSVKPEILGEVRAPEPSSLKLQSVHLNLKVAEMVLKKTP